MNTTQSNPKLLALLVGINNYHPKGPMKTLEGCVNDINLFAECLERYNQIIPENQRFELHIKKLSNEEATKANVIEAFRSHLRDQADENTTVLFQFSGHGAYQPTANDFKNLIADHNKREESIVTYDSRVEIKWDLADKELAILLSEIHEKKAHILVLMDCCHAGSGTREAIHPQLGAFRQAEMIDLSKYKRSLKSYLDGYFIAQQENSGKIEIPKARHLLMAASRSDEYSREVEFDGVKNGLFTKSLVDVLNKYIERKERPSYADLHSQVQERILAISNTQHPQFESFQFFPVQSYFLEGKSSAKQQQRYMVFFKGEACLVELGAAQGFALEADQKLEFTIYETEASDKPLGCARSQQMGNTQTLLELIDTDLNSESIYWAELMNFHGDKLWVYFPELPKLAEQFEVIQLSSPYVNYTQEAHLLIADKILLSEANHLEIYYKQKCLFTRPLQQAVDLEETLVAQERIARWRRLQGLKNPKTQIDHELIDFTVQVDQVSSQAQVGLKGQLTTYVSEEQYGAAESPWKAPLALIGKNNSDQDLYFCLLYFSPDYSVTAISNQLVPAQSGEFQFLDGAAINPYHFSEITHFYKLVVSTVPLEAQAYNQLGLSNLESTRDLSQTVAQLAAEDWFTKTIHVQLVKNLGLISPEADFIVSPEQLVIKKHAHFKAEIALRAAYLDMPHISENFLADWIDQSNYELVNFAAEPRLDERVLELSNYSDPSSLETEPLIILIKKSIKVDSQLIPLSLNGDTPCKVGKTYSDENRFIRVEITRLPPKLEKDAPFQIYFIQASEAWSGAEI